MWIEIVCLLGGAFLGILTQKCLALLGNLKKSSRPNVHYFSMFNRLVIHCLIVGIGIIAVVFLYPGQVGQPAELFIGGFLIAGCIWCWVLSVREKRRQSVAAETDPNTSE